MLCVKCCTKAKMTSKLNHPVVSAFNNQAKYFGKSSVVLAEMNFNFMIVIFQELSTWSQQNLAVLQLKMDRIRSKYQSVLHWKDDLQKDDNCMLLSNGEGSHIKFRQSNT